MLSLPLGLAVQTHVEMCVSMRVHMYTHMGQEIMPLPCLQGPPCTPREQNNWQTGLEAHCPGLVSGTETSNSGREEGVREVAQPKAG